MEPVDVQPTDLNPWADAPKVVSQEWVQEIVKAYQAQTERLQAIVNVLEPFDTWTLGDLAVIRAPSQPAMLAISLALQAARDGLK